MKILFVCTGNTCRSPMAEIICNFLANKSNIDCTGFSRGTNVIVSQPMNEKSNCALQKHKIDSYILFSKQLMIEDVKTADLVLTMTTSQKMILKNAFPDFKNKIYTLKEKAFGKDADIVDPFGGTQEIYNDCCNEILEAVSRVLCLI